MAIINGRYYSSFGLGRYSAYASLQIQRYQAAQANQQYFQMASAASDAFMTAGTNLATGLAQLAGQAAVKNAQAAATAQAANTTNAADTTGNTVDLSSLLNTVNMTA
jgi:hypothetical protein